MMTGWPELEECADDYDELLATAERAGDDT
jgi:hypothetical protein